MTKTINLREFPGLIPKYWETQKDKIRAAVGNGIMKSLADIVRNTPVDTGLMAQSWDFTIEETKAIIGNYAPHAPVVEYGARPFTPPILPLLAWAKRVLQDPSQPPNYSDAVRALAYHTRAKIQHEGMSPNNIMEKSLPDIIRNIKEELRAIR